MPWRGNYTWIQFRASSVEEESAPAVISLVWSCGLGRGSLPLRPELAYMRDSPAGATFIAGRRAGGQSFGNFSEETGVPKSTVIDTCQKAEK